ncbi:MAG: hypothetical protein IT423_13015 [Pirellulaceae bacterium]|nr:hypothetical protein [Pirellulaceae bacterium]
MRPTDRLTTLALDCLLVLMCFSVALGGSLRMVMPDWYSLNCPAWGPTHSEGPAEEAPVEEAPGQSPASAELPELEELASVSSFELARRRLRLDSRMFRRNWHIAGAGQVAYAGVHSRSEVCLRNGCGAYLRC